MAGIPIYTESPISPVAAKATAITPQTAAAPQSPYDSAPERSPSPYTPATTTAAAPTSTSAYMPAQPAAAPAARTSYIPAEPTSTSTLPTPTQSQPQPTPTTSLPTMTSSSSPAPQPGALPAPFVPKSRTPSPGRSIPPPPKAGEKVQPPSYYSPTPTPTYFSSPQPFPPQMSFPPTTDPRAAGVPPAGVTSSAQQANGGYSYANGNINGLLSPQSARLPYGQPQQPGQHSAYASPAQTPLTATGPGDISSRRSFEHPPGYVQNPYAADMTPDQRFATAHSPGSPSLGWNATGPAKSPGILGTGVSAPVGGLGGILNGGGGSGDESVWGMVGGWVKGVGKKVGEVEESVWKKINGT